MSEILSAIVGGIGGAVAVLLWVRRQDARARH
jgi:hypothetical protein